MSPLSLETWKTFQAQGRRSVLSRALMLGIVFGATGGIVAGLVLGSSGTWRVSPAKGVLILALSTASATGVTAFLASLLLWELLRRKFSQIKD
jgi:hypothetical protein